MERPPSSPRPPRREGTSRLDVDPKERERLIVELIRFHEEMGKKAEEWASHPQAEVRAIDAAVVAYDINRAWNHYVRRLLGISEAEYDVLLNQLV